MRAVKHLHISRCQAVTTPVQFTSHKSPVRHSPKTKHYCPRYQIAPNVPLTVASQKATHNIYRISHKTPPKLHNMNFIISFEESYVSHYGIIDEIVLVSTLHMEDLCSNETSAFTSVLSKRLHSPPTLEFSDTRD